MLGASSRRTPALTALCEMVDVGVNGKTLKRPITRISLLEIRDTEL